MAPYGACRNLTVPVKSHKVQLEARHSWKQSDFERDFEGKTSMVERTKKHARKCFRRKKKYARAVISSAQWPRRKKKHARALISSAQWPRRNKKHAREVISNAQRLAGATKSKLEQ